MARTPPRIPGLSDWRPLARGGFATVWEARQESLDRLVAVKVDQRSLDAETERRRFLREAGAAGRMSGHPGIVTVHDAGILGDNRPFLVMELCPGGSLTRWLRPEARPTQPQVRDVGARIADALAAAHSRGVLHRDVKPANIMIDAFDNAGLADFGLAAMPEPGEELSETLEAITPAYAPPEAFQQRPPTEFGDVFSLAATLYALLAGRPPRWTSGEAPSVAEALQQQHVPIRPIPGVDQDFMDLLMTALSTEPTERPTAAQFRDRLLALALTPGSTVPAAPDRAEPPLSAATSGAVADTDEETPADPRTRRRRSLAVLALVAALVALVVLVTALVLPGDTPGTATPGAVPSASVDATALTATPSPTPTPSATTLPSGFTDCSEELGEGALCATVEECWGGLFTYADQPALGTAADCNSNHVYQSFAGGELTYEVRRQSQLEADPLVRRICTAEVANSMLPPAERRKDWEVFALPPQNESPDDHLFRCIVGRGERSTPRPLQLPG